MKRSTIALAVVAVLGATWMGGAWFTGQKAETEYKNQLEKINQQFQTLGDSNTVEVSFKNKQFDRGFFSSQVEDEVIVSFPNEGESFTIPLSTTLYHGPIPLNHLAKFNFVPAIFSAEGSVGKNETTQPLFDVLKTDKPIQYAASTSYGLNIKGALDIAAGEYANPSMPNNKVNWSKIHIGVDVSKDLATQYELNLDEIKADIQENPNQAENAAQAMLFHMKGLKLEGDIAPTQWPYIYTGKSHSSAEKLTMNTTDKAGNITSVVENAPKGITEVTVNNGFIDLKNLNTLDSLFINEKNWGKVTYNMELNHIEGHALNALMESFVVLLKAMNNGESDSMLSTEIFNAWFQQHGAAILSNQPQIKLSPISMSDNQGKLALDLNVSLVQNPKFDLMRSSLYKQFKDFSIDITVDKATATTLLSNILPDAEKSDAKQRIEQLANEGEANGIVMNSEKTVRLNIKLENNELKLNGHIVPEEQLKMILFMLSMSSLGK